MCEGPPQRQENQGCVESSNRFVIFMSIFLYLQTFSMFPSANCAVLFEKRLLLAFSSSLVSAFLLSLSFDTDFEALVKSFVKAKSVVEKNGIPRVYIRTLAELEDFVKEVRS